MTAAVVQTDMMPVNRAAAMSRLFPGRSGFVVAAGGVASAARVREVADPKGR